MFCYLFKDRKAETKIADTTWSILEIDTLHDTDGNPIDGCISAADRTIKLRSEFPDGDTGVRERKLRELEKQVARAIVLEGGLG